MIIIQILGGLGNQMFQYALGRGLAHKHEVEFKLDISGFAAYPLRAYSLQHFNIQENIASADDLQRYQNNSIPARTYRKLEGYLKPYWQRSIIREPSYGFNPHVLQVRSGFLVGYWQSYKYFDFIAPILQTEFQLKTPASIPIMEIAQLIQKVTSVSLHIRRGDYVSNPTTQNVHGVMPLSYYQSGIQHISKTVDDPHYFIFSDDPQWALDHLHLQHPATIVSGSNPDYDDFRLLMLCQHHIIANSSFSWWGAWLSNSPNKIVIAPKQWTILPEGNTPDRIPPTWIQL